MTKKKSKAQRIRELLEKGKSAHYISNTLNVTLQHVYNVRWHMKNTAKAAGVKAAGVEAPRVGEATIILPKPPQQIEALNDRNKTESIQGEYGKYQQMTTWQRIKFNFKSALGF